MNPDVIIDCVGGQDIEDASRQALGNRGHFVTIMGPGSGAFGDGGDGAKEQMVQGMKIASRSVTSNTDSDPQIPFCKRNFNIFAPGH